MRFHHGILCACPGDYKAKNLGAQDKNVRNLRGHESGSSLTSSASLIATVTEPDVASYWSNVVKGFELNPQDIPLAVIYSLESDGNDPSVSSEIKFQEALGIGEDHALALKGVPLDRDDNPTAVLFKEAVAANGPTVLQEEDGDLPDYLLQGVEWRG